MLQQLALGDDLFWFDWVAAALLAVFVIFQGVFHLRLEREKARPNSGIPLASKSEDSAVSTPPSRTSMATGLVVFAVGMVLLATLAGYPGQAYALATIATAAKTFAWWINQYPALKDWAFLQKWLAGWSIAAIIEYLPLIGAFTIASEHGVHLGLMTAYMVGPTTL
jgi:hypothetical protein